MKHKILTIVKDQLLLGFTVRIEYLGVWYSVNEYNSNPPIIMSSVSQVNDCLSIWEFDWKNKRIEGLTSGGNPVWYVLRPL